MASAALRAGLFIEVAGVEVSADSRDPTTLYIDVRYTIRGTENPPERHFCRRCAMSLAAAPAPAIPRPW